MSADSLKYANLAGVIAVQAFLWNLHRDIVGLRDRMARLEGDLRERLARLEGAVDLLTEFLVDRECRPAEAAK